MLLNNNNESVIFNLKNEKSKDEWRHACSNKISISCSITYILNQTRKNLKVTILEYSRLDR